MGGRHALALCVALTIGGSLPRLLLFPTIWVVLWAGIAALSPLGTLSTWSPVEGTGAYDWLVPWFSGPYALNWVAAAWATILSQTLTSLYMGPTSGGENGHGSQASHSVRSVMTANDKTALLAAVLVLLTVPSYIGDSLPVPLGDVSKGTPLVIGCALPTVDEYKVPEFKFEHFLAESKRLDNTANFILWPEGAVRFSSEKERNDSLAEVQKNILHAFVGVSFEETVEDAENSNNRHGVRRTGIAIVSNRSPTPHLLYYKQHLVPIAESFSLTHSLESPTTFSAEITYPKRIPVPGHKREIPVTASICLDFSAPSQFTNLEVRPGLILAPARTWDTTVGYTMWKQASQRAREIGSTVLWCDGGEGGVSGVAGHGYNEVVQVGSGSWLRTIALEFPFDENSRTLYGHYGNAVLLVFCVMFYTFHHVLVRSDYEITDLSPI
ncbi:hypothetical protein AGABI1DRAFT_117613 [Agaricus bisporus var. burnettii JB137-S8]|uniref:CN hydrolase domain-containing protein n=1 Tax=Agaricus bisporus var. burnettii (strain JB137-S8 / ATCC MYA-4627 / FGSC 10392) TaxID=597362 RepID=K5Y7G6_AGABU|nr:uncharacterized protein AGABI1DRAFT_117613 [Agaricus bisporus var. burnettii JB137-S8]EKM84180.1 hypothetical protein AGABI1DRAFT_117613 [Agaricus bisporus var. burnettii JB137-S8]